MATEQSKATDQDRIRATALRQARDIDDRKRLKARVADLIVEAFDLPTNTDADPASPQPADDSAFRHCLSLFQPSDLDDLIYERNVDNRCGYGLCPKPNLKLAHGGEKVWNQKGGKDFRLVDRVKLEQWCSEACQERTAFVRAQLGTEPAWLRVVRAVDIKLLDEISSSDLADSFKVCSNPFLSLSIEQHNADHKQTLAIAKSPDDDVTEKMQALALERRELNVKLGGSSIDVVERSSENIPRAPALPKYKQARAVEGHQPRQVHFSEN